MGLFVFQWTITTLGIFVHAVFDPSPARRTRRRLLELATLWVIGANGLVMIMSAIGLIGPDSISAARSVAYAHSMFEWEIGWADAALGALSLVAVLRRNRGAWLTATVIAWKTLSDPGATMPPPSSPWRRPASPGRRCATAFTRTASTG